MTALLLTLGIFAVALIPVVLSRANGPDLPPPECSEEEARKILAEYGVEERK